MTRLPLDDVRVVAVEQFGAGPWATLQLADLGADVIKIEDPRAGGDVGRYVPPFQEGEDSLFFETFNRSKKSVSLDLRHPEARPVLEDLVRASDAVYSNLRGDGPARLGLTYEQLKDVNPRIVCCSLSGFGMTGPRAAEGGYDFMMQGLAGWQLLTGDPDGPPTKSGISLVDLSGGYASTIALLAGLWRARRDGVGCDCDVSLFETALQELMYIGPWAATHGYVPPRRHNSAHASIVPFQNFRASDGWIVVAAAKQSFWERLCDVIGEPGLADDPRFATMAARDENRDELVPMLERRLATRTVQEWLDVLVTAGIPAAKVNTVLEALAEPQTEARGDIVEHEHPTLGTVRTIRTALRLEADGESLERPAARGPFRGEHTDEVLAELCGYAPERLGALRAAGVFGETKVPGGVSERDFVGYGATPPDPHWPGGARLALNFVLNYEEGGENTPLEGDPTSEAFLHEVVGAPATVGRRNLNTESMFEYGSRAGFWRVHRIFDKHGLPMTVYAVGQALERNPEAARAMIASGWEVASHGWRWIDYMEMSEDEEREHMKRAIAAIEGVTGQRPVGWYTGRISDNTRRLVVEEGGFLYDSDSYADELPYWVEVAGQQHLVIPYTLDANDFKFLLVNGFVTGDQFYSYLVDAFDQLREEGGRMLSVGLHCRVVGRPGRAKALDAFLGYVRRHDDVWVTTRAEIARHWREHHPPP